MEYAYLISDPDWPPTLYEVRGEDSETGLKIVSPAGRPEKVLYLYPEDIWPLC